MEYRRFAKCFVYDLKLTPIIINNQPIEVPYSTLKVSLINCICPKNFEIVERAKKKSEDAVTFSMTLKQLASTCNFGSKLQEQLHDRFVMGLLCDKCDVR